MRDRGRRELALGPSEANDARDSINSLPRVKAALRKVTCHFDPCPCAWRFSSRATAKMFRLPVDRGNAGVMRKPSIAGSSRASNSGGGGFHGEKARDEISLWLTWTALAPKALGAGCGWPACRQAGPCARSRMLSKLRRSE